MGVNNIVIPEKPKGQFSTPYPIANLMVKKLFKFRQPDPEDRLLDPGCGDGVFIEAVLEWCNRKGIKLPRILGVELDSRLASICRRKFTKYKEVTVTQKDFLAEDFGQFDFIICNPPYVRLEELSEEERSSYRRIYKTAFGKFNLYMLFFEKALKALKDGGRLVIITPEKFEYTLSSAPLRRLIARYHVEELHHLKEGIFKGLVTYPTITVINKVDSSPTKIIKRDGLSFYASLPKDGSPWIPVIEGKFTDMTANVTLKDLTKRISCGVATGKDNVFIIEKNRVPENLLEIAYPTISGRDLTPEGIRVSHMMIIPYDREGRLLPKDKLKDFIRWIKTYKKVLEERYCVRKGKRAWYEFHERPPMSDILRPKILCKDITKEPTFWIDEKGMIVPRHSVYYIVPKNYSLLHKLYKYLNSEKAKRWIVAHAQRATNGFIRLQSNTLKDLPMPQESFKIATIS